MKPTAQQLKIIDANGNIKINAVAGSGKTTTLIAYAKAQPKTAKILYLAFNKSVKTEALSKFKQAGLTNVKVETAHSLAFKHIVRKHNYTIKANGYKTYEIVEILGLTGNGEQHAEYIIANHINNFIAYFCNSTAQKVEELNYLDVISDEKAKTFAKSFYNYIFKQTRALLAKMNSGEIEITHDFYLKKFQLANPKLNYHNILFDEGQDASPAMLDVFLNQNAIKVIVGDSHQQIYSWRYAVNSLNQVNFKPLTLTTSFRFNQNLANLSNAILDLKKYLSANVDTKVEGVGKSNTTINKAVIARTNLGLLVKAIEMVVENESVKNLYFEGNINSYTYADDGASLYDVLNLYNGKKWLVKDQLIKKMADMDALEDYIDKTADVQLNLMVEVINEYGNKIPSLIKKIKKLHVNGDENRSNAEVIFTTVHKAKGMEYDTVQLAEDFINEAKLIEFAAQKEKPNELERNKLNEEINLLYVAVSRAKSKIFIPQSLLPKGFEPSKQIVVFNNKSYEQHNQQFYNKPKVKPKASTQATTKAYSVETIRTSHKKAYMPWTDELDNELTEMFCENNSTKLMAVHFGRTTGAIRSRIKKLELKEIYK